MPKSDDPKQATFNWSVLLDFRRTNFRRWQSFALLMGNDCITARAVVERFQELYIRMAHH